MKSRTLLVIAALLTLSATHAAYAQGPGPVGRVPKPALLGPDLITDGIRELDLNNGKIEIAVRNIGKKASVASLVRVLITPAGENNTTGRSKTVRALAPGEYLWIAMSFGKPLNLAKYCAIADVVKQNQETNEKNNERCGDRSFIVFRTATVKATVAKRCCERGHAPSIRDRVGSNYARRIVDRDDIGVKDVPERALFAFSSKLDLPRVVRA